MLDHHHIRNCESALFYMIECTLSTIHLMIQKKKTAIGELKRQIDIAQNGIYYLVTIASMDDINKIDSRTHLSKVIHTFGNDVTKWTLHMRSKHHPQYTKLNLKK